MAEESLGGEIVAIGDLFEIDPAREFRLDKRLIRYVGDLALRNAWIIQQGWIAGEMRDYGTHIAGRPNFSLLVAIHKLNA
jgi:hypothetical protein